MAAIFDMDGLLINTDPVIWVESMHEVAAQYQVDVTTELLQHTKGLRIYEVTEFWNEHFQWNDSAKSEEIAENIVDAVLANSYKKGKVMPGVIALLEDLRKAEIPLGVATSSPERLCSQLLSFFNLSSYFSVVSTADTCISGKPHPEVYLQCASKLSVLPWKCVAFEDSVNGMIAAKAARMKAVVVPANHQMNDSKFGLADQKVASLLEFNVDDYIQLLSQ